jgi:hypothetical protein
MAWIWVWIGGALVLGFSLGVTLMSLLGISQDGALEGRRRPRRRPNWRARPC